MDWGRLYAIADAETLARRGVGLREFAEGLKAAGVGIVQLRDKVASSREVLEEARVMLEVFRGTGCVLVMNDRVDLAVIAGFGGVHLGQEDMGVEDARKVGLASGREAFVVGVSTHTEEQVRAAESSSADYVATGPVFATGTKADAAAVVGLEGVRWARGLATKPLVAVGGITRQNCGSVVEAGADLVAVISGLVAEGESMETGAREFLALLKDGCRS